MSAAARAERAAFVAIPILFALGLLAAGVLPVPVVVLSIPFIVILVRKPVLRRLAFRNASRRPRETALILLGALLGTAIITGSAIVGDTLGSSIRQSAFTQLGPIDEIVRTSSFGEQSAAAGALAQLEDDEAFDGVLPITVVGAAIATPGDGERRAEPGASLVELDFAAARAFGDDPDATGIDGPTPTGTEAVIGEDLAATLGVEVGDQVVVYAYQQERAFTVVRTVPRRGVAGINFGFGSRSPNLFVEPGTIRGLVEAGQGAPPFPMVAVSNAGGVIAGAATSDAAVERIEAALGDTTAQVIAAKQNLLEVADRQGEQFTQLFTSIGFFSVIAGILLLVSIFVMLAEERKTELGMLRAVGLKRAGLVGTFSLEGWLYSLGSAGLGTIAGLGVGRAIVFVTAGIFASGDDRFALDLQYSATLESIRGGFLIGFAMSLVTVVITSLWIARLNVIRAIRDLPSPTAERQRILWVILGTLVVVLVGIPMTLTGLANNRPASILIGPAVIGFGAAPALRRLMPSRVANTIASGFVLFWSIFAFDIAGRSFKNPDISLFVVDGVLLTISAVFLVAQHQELIGRVLRRLGGGARNMALRLGLAYPLARSFRTSIILMTFALVMFTLTSITLFSGTFAGQIEQFTKDVSGGFDVRMRSNSSNPVDVAAVEAVDGVNGVAAIATAGGQFKLPASPKAEQREFMFWGVAGISEQFVEIGPPALEERSPEFASDTDAFAALLARPDAVIVSDFFLQDGGGPPEGQIQIGDEVVARNPDTGLERMMTVIALSRPSFGPDEPVFMGVETARALLGERVAADLLYIDVDPAADPVDLAERLNGQFIANGADAASFRELVAEGLAQQQSFFRLMQGYLSLGLVVGVAGLGVVMVRAVRERRREVGVLRALGFDTAQVRRAFVAESAFVAFEGIMIGAALAMISTWRLIGSGAFGEGLSFSIPVVQVAVVIGLAFAATLVATAAPAQQASRIKPAVALRITD